MTCAECGDLGWIVVEETDWVCCGNYLPTGECCAAIYGTDRLVPEPHQTQQTCPSCQGMSAEPQPPEPRG